MQPCTRIRFFMPCFPISSMKIGKRPDETTAMKNSSATIQSRWQSLFPLPRPSRTLSACVVLVCLLLVLCIHRNIIMIMTLWRLECTDYSPATGLSCSWTNEIALLQIDSWIAHCPLSMCEHRAAHARCTKSSVLQCIRNWRVTKMKCGKCSNALHPNEINES